MFLSRLLLDPRDRTCRRDLADLQALHRRVMAAFPGGASRDGRAAHGVLWRVEPAGRLGRLMLLVQSATPPDWSRLPDGYLATPEEVKQIDEALAAIRVGSRLQFRLVANPTRKIDTKSGLDGVRRNGRRVPLRGDEALLAWLVRKAQDAGFSVADDPTSAARRVVVRPLGDLIGWRGAGRMSAARLTFRGAAFDGILEVTDADRLREAIVAGIGPGKAYGYGLLSLAPAR